MTDDLAFFIGVMGSAFVSTSMVTSFSIAALEEAIETYGCPEIFSTESRRQMTSEAFTGELNANDIAISMDGKGSWVANVFVERLRRCVKYEEVYLLASDAVCIRGT